MAEPVPPSSLDVAHADAAVARQGTQDGAPAFNLPQQVADARRAPALAARSSRPGGLLISKAARSSSISAGQPA